MPKEILVIKHIDIEGLGSIADFFGNTAWTLKVSDASKERLDSKNLGKVAAIISLGGPMNVYEENKYPFLKEEDALLKKALKAEIPVLGICLGAQLLAKACGAKVKRAKKEEVGWFKVDLTAAGKKDPLFENLPAELTVFQWHEDSFEIPGGGRHLAESVGCPNQAFRFGRNAYGLQFHLEVTPEIIESWMNRYKKEDSAEFSCKDCLIESYKRRDALKKDAEIVSFNFARIIAAGKIKAG
ncbi:MAG: type 1 glutamine amidotransferase [Candidatus Omnitrophota bacterium]|jgi:GMP synthase-like glutamine amidotransferase